MFRPTVDVGTKDTKPLLTIENADIPFLATHQRSQNKTGTWLTVVDIDTTKLVPKISPEMIARLLRLGKEVEKEGPIHSYRITSEADAHISGPALERDLPTLRAWAKPPSRETEQPADALARAPQLTV